MRLHHRGFVLCALAAAAMVACGHNPAAPDGTGITFNFPTADVVIGDTLQLTATVKDNSGSPVPNATVTWTSLDPSIAAVSADGLVTALDMGIAEIEADSTVPDLAQKGSMDTWFDRALARFSTPVHAAASRRGTARMNVKPNIVITPANPSVGIKGTQQFAVNITNSKQLVLKNLTLPVWSSSTKSVATIDVAGLATGVAKGTTTIGASVTSKSRLGNLTASDATTLTVSDQCDGIASVSSLSASLDYDYQNTGKSAIATITSNFHAAGLKANLTRDFAVPEAGVAQWRGSITGSASQSETKTYPDGPPDTLKESGPPERSQMIVTANLTQCTFRIVATLFYPVTRTDRDKAGEGGVDVHTGDNKLHLKNDLGSYFGNDAEPESYPVSTNPVVDTTVFVISGFAQEIDGDLGKAQVDFFLSVTGTNDQGKRAVSRRLPGLVEALEDVSRLIIPPRPRRD